MSDACDTREIEMILENIVGTIATEVAKATGKALVDKALPIKYPLIKDVGFLNVIPRRIGLSAPLSPDEKNGATFGGLWNLAFDGGVWNCQWIDSAELCFRIENIDDRNSIYVKGIHVESDVVDDCPKASLFQEMQGSSVSGECHRFVTVLDSGLPIMQRYNLIDQKVQLLGERQFFDGSTIEIPSKSGVNIALSLLVERVPRAITEVSVIYGVIGGDELYRKEVGIEAPIRIYPLSAVPSEQRFRTTWSSLNRRDCAVTTEDDESALPRSSQVCRWEGEALLRR